MAENISENINLQSSPVISKINPVTSTDLSSDARAATIEEWFLKFCAGLEKRFGEVKNVINKRYSNLDPRTIAEMKQSLSVAISDPHVKSDDPLADQKYETARAGETLKIVAQHQNESPVVRDENSYQLPAIENPDGVTLCLIADLHHGPSYLREGIRTEKYRGYGPQRAIEKITDMFKRRKRFPEIPEDMTSVDLRYVISEDVRQAFYDWMVEVISGGQVDSEGLATPVLVNMGDAVHDGTFLLDQMGVNQNIIGLLDEIGKRNPSLKPHLLQLYGNHDCDSRIPESITYLTELFGHRIFTREMGGVTVAAVDTNLMNPEWIAQFNSRADDLGKQVLAKRIEIQQKILADIQASEKPVMLLGHNPARIIDELAVKKQVLQDSNVVAIIGGHTHKESHLKLPFKNKSGKQVVMHVVESVVRSKSGDPVPPKMFTIRIKDGVVGDMFTLQEPEESFDKRYQARVQQQELY